MAHIDIKAALILLIASITAVFVTIQLGLFNHCHFKFI
jgi:hypothetical protein